MKKLKMINSIAFILTMLMAFPSIVYSADDLEEIKKELVQLRQDVAAASEWRNSNSLLHIGGYADVGYIKTDAATDDGNFNAGTFAPIFHYQYRDLVLMESELEIELEDDGTTDLKIEYLTIDWFINDNMTLVAGQFLSPIGNFRQNLHPSWINKLPSAPPGFGHDGAAPLSDLGFQLRGGFNLAGIKATYAAYMGNGPELKAEITPDAGDSTVIDEIEFDGIEAEAFGADRDGEKVIGGRFGLYPMPSLEIGLSFLSGKATVTEFEGAEFTGTNPSLAGVTVSNYDVTGIDVSWHGNGMDARYEYVKSEVGDTAIGGFALAASEWITWYGQFSYRFLPGKYEAVFRYTDFDTPHASADRQQTAIGLNYLVSSNFIAKLGFESNDNPNAGQVADDRWLVQLAYGF